MLNHLLEGSNLHLDIMASVTSHIIEVMKNHKTSSAVQLEALRAILHIIVPESKKEPEEDASLNISLKVIKNSCLLNDIHKLVLGALNKVCLEIHFSFL
ncbi:leucine-rich repeat serine/threonine-protein kinase 2-like [Gracilinanus agilis]|uniref:leucine-rich repeat serine/threonine-protein kinase 2-like n=1 Tax=Gracilinanus agilis TaxID=191870 RepID=UPI001CFDE9B0|nr:leucine-rich repeat serine/threonine-protein kinase 2-like [Gracilinanus agilis]